MFFQAFLEKNYLQEDTLKTPLPPRVFIWKETPTTATWGPSSHLHRRQDYITARVASFLGIDLTALDPDGIGEEGGMFRLNVFGAALPTLFGIWWDTRRRDLIFFFFGTVRWGFCARGEWRGGWWVRNVGGVGGCWAWRVGLMALGVYRVVWMGGWGWNLREGGGREVKLVGIQIWWLWVKLWKMLIF